MTEAPIRNLMLALMLDAWNTVSTRGRSFANEYRARETLRWVSGRVPDARIDFSAVCTYLGWDIEATREAFRRGQVPRLTQRPGPRRNHKIGAT